MSTGSLAAKSFYFVRHGRTDANEQSLMCGGDWDLAINSSGRSQAEYLARYAPAFFREIKAICASPMSRAMQTAEILNARLGVPLLTVEGFREWRVGTWEKRPWDEFADKLATGETPPGGESLADFERRVTLALSASLAVPGPVLIVAHGAVWYSVLSALGLERSRLDNCSPRGLHPEVVDGRVRWHLRSYAAAETSSRPPSPQP